MDLWFGIFGCDLSFGLFCLCFWIRDFFCGLGFVISGSGSLVWDLWFEIFALKPLVSNLCVDLFSLDRNLRFGIFALRHVVRNLWFGIFGLCAVV